MRGITSSGTQKVFAILLVFILAACSSEFSDRPPLAGGLSGSGIAYTPTQELGGAPTSQFPWEVWSYDKDLKGDPITNPFIAKGDEAIRQGNKAVALENYKRAVSGSQAFQVKEALALRIASTQLSLDRPKDSLVTLSQFFRANSVDVSSVDAPFALIFAYAYGRVNDIDQSLAWFSRLNKMQSKSGSFQQSAIIGASLLFRTMEDKELINLANLWTEDSFVSSLIGQERARRMRLGGAVELAPRDKPFWLAVGPTDPIVGQGLSTETTLGVASGREFVVGALLPMTGRFSNLGDSTAKGINLAFTDAPIKIVLSIEDTFGDPTAAITAADRLLRANRPSVVLGPLLSEPATAVVPILRQQGVPELTFSRKESLGYGSTAFRLGATSESQVKSILNVVAGNFGIKRVAIIYRQDSTGFEYLRDFQNISAEKGLSVVYQTSYGEDFRQSFYQIAQELELSGAEALFFPDELDAANVLLSDLTPAFRKRLQVLGSASWDNTQKLSSARTVFDGAIFVSPFFTRSDREIVKRFIDVYKNTNGTEPDFLAAQGFDAATMILAALGREANEGIQFIDAFRAIENYNGLTGHIWVRPDGSLERQFAVIQLTENGLRELEPTTRE